MQLFGTKGQKVPSLSRDKGTTGQDKNLAKGRDGPGQPKSCKYSKVSRCTDLSSAELADFLIGSKN